MKGDSLTASTLKILKQTHHIKASLVWHNFSIQHDSDTIPFALQLQNVKVLTLGKHYLLSYHLLCFFEINQQKLVILTRKHVLRL